MNSSLEESDGDLDETPLEEAVEKDHDVKYVMNERPHTTRVVLSRL